MDRIQADTQRVSATMYALRKIREHLRNGFARLPKEEMLTALKSALSKRGDPEIRAEYALALGGVGTPEAGKILADTLKKEKDALVRVTILDTLRIRKMGTEDIVVAVAPLLKDSFWQVAVAAARLLESVGSPSAVEFLIEELKTAENRLKEEINQALIGLTQVNKHGSYPAWKDWWDRNGKQFIAGQYTAPEGGSGKQEGSSRRVDVLRHRDQIRQTGLRHRRLQLHEGRGEMETADRRRGLGREFRHSGGARAGRSFENRRREI